MRTLYQNGLDFLDYYEEPSDKEITIDELKKLIANAVENNEIQQSIDCWILEKNQYPSGVFRIWGRATLTTGIGNVKIDVDHWFNFFEDDPAGSMDHGEIIDSYNINVIDVTNRGRIVERLQSLRELPTIIKDIDKNQIIEGLVKKGIIPLISNT